MFLTSEEEDRVMGILAELNMLGDADIVLIDAALRQQTFWLKGAGCFFPEIFSEEFSDKACKISKAAGGRSKFWLRVYE